MTTQSKPLSVLIVEDDNLSKTILVRMLEKSNLPVSNVEHATDLAGAIALLDGRYFDVVLLDLNLPDSPGINTVDTIHERHPEAAIVVITGEYDDKAGLDAIAKGAQEYVIKDSLSQGILSKSILYAVERRKIDLELQVASERYRSVFENSAVAIMVADKQERITSWNRATSSLLKMSDDQLYLKPVKELYAEGEWQRLRNRGIREKGKEQNYETRMVRRDGELIDVDISLSVMRDCRGAIAGSIGVVSDITERKRIHEILDHKQRNLEAIFDAAPVGMLLLDDRLVVKRANEAIKNMFGKEYSDMIHQSVGAAVGCKNSEFNREGCGHSPSCASCQLGGTLRHTLKSERSFGEVEVCLTLMSSQGAQTRWLGISAEPTILDDEKHVVAAIVDISSRKEAQERLKETMELKAQFVAMVSHELRTPLGCMKEAVGLVLDGVSGPINNKQQDLLEIIKRNIERLGLLANDALDIHKLESGQMKLDLDDHDVFEVVQEVHKTMNCAASKKKIHLMLEKEGRLARAHVDRDKIVQVLTNLLSNAIKFTPDGGRITTRLQQEDDHLRIQVTDTGIGIPAKHLPSIFDRFFQVQELYQQTKGTGLGLSIVKNIVEMHGGTVQVESEVDKGTTFTIVLPLRMNAELENESKSADLILEHIMSE